MFNFGIDRKTLIIIFAVMAGFWLISMGTSGILGILLAVPGVLIAMTFHEYAHAYAAYKLGDDTPKLQGRLNLNPISHIDPVGILLLLVAGFGWGKPVQIDSRNFNGKYSISKSEAIVAAAGPIMNFVLAFLFMILYYIIFQVTNITVSLSSNGVYILKLVMQSIITINIGLGVFNLIPLPPLDGSKILMHFLNYNGKEWFYRNERTFYIIFLLLWVTGLLSTVLSPVFSAVFSGMSWVVYMLMGIFF